MVMFKYMFNAEKNAFTFKTGILPSTLDAQGTIFIIGCDCMFIGSQNAFALHIRGWKLFVVSLAFAQSAVVLYVDSTCKAVLSVSAQQMHAYPSHHPFNVHILYAGTKWGENHTRVNKRRNQNHLESLIPVNQCSFLYIHVLSHILHKWLSLGKLDRKASIEEGTRR